VPTIRELYNDLFSGKRITIRFATRNEYESMRTALHRAHQIPRFLLETTTDALCADYNSAKGVGVFWLGTSRRAGRKIEIVSITEVDDEQQIQRDMGSNQEGADGPTTVGGGEAIAPGYDADNHQHGTESQEQAERKS
jgi:hypothetical protein